MSGYVPLINDYSVEMILPNINRTGRLKGSTVRTILQAELTTLAHRIKLKNFSNDAFIHENVSLGVKNFGKYTVAAMAFCCCIVITTTSLTAAFLADDDPSDFAYIGIALPIGAVLMMVCAGIYDGGKTCIYYHDGIKITSDRSAIITRYMQTLDDETVVDARQLAELMTHMNWNTNTPSSLLSKASVEEFAEIVAASSLSHTWLVEPPQKALFSLLSPQNLDPDEFFEVAGRAMPMLRSEQDRNYLMAKLPLDDPKIPIFRKLIEQSIAPPLEQPIIPPASVVIEIPPSRNIEIVIQDTRIKVDNELLRAKSKWFKACLSGGFGPAVNNTIVISDTPERSHILIDILQNLSNLDKLWASTKGGKNQEKIFDCLIYYQFNDELHSFASTLFASYSEVKDQIHVAGVAISSNLSEDNLWIWWERCFESLIKNQIDLSSYTQWLDFCLQHFLKETQAAYRVHLDTHKIPMYAIGEMIKREQLLKPCFKAIRQQIKNKLDSSDVKFSSPPLEPELLSWIGKEMQLPNTTFISINNFKHLWDMNCPDFKQGLVMYATAHNLEVMNLWEMGKIPIELLSVLRKNCSYT